MEIYLKKYGKSNIIVSILLLVASLFLIFKPIVSMDVIMIILGCIAVIDGLIHVVLYITEKKEYKAFSFELVQGIIYILLGFLLVFNYDIIKDFLPILIGSWILIESVIKFQLSFDVKDLGGKNWAIILVLSILTAIVGLLMIFNPFASMITLVTLSGIALLISALINLIETLFLIAV